jgi:hypothetical protein
MFNLYSTLLYWKFPYQLHIPFQGREEGVGIKNCTYQHYISLETFFKCHESQPMFFLGNKLSSLGDKNKGVGTNAKNYFKQNEPKLPYLEVEIAKVKQ